MKKLILIMIFILTVVISLPIAAQNFSDLEADHWSYEAVNKLAAVGIIEGYPDGQFKGQRTMSRYEMAVMVSRALNNIKAEMEAMDRGLTMAEARDVTKVVRALMEKNTRDDLSDAQVDQVADIVDALTYELESELKVLGFDLANLNQDLDQLEAKIDALQVPEDKIEFAVEISTIFETANYDYQNQAELAAAMALWADADALDLDLPIAADGNPVLPEAGTDYRTEVADWKDADDLPAEKSFWQEYDFIIDGSTTDSKFTLELDTISNLFAAEDSAFDYAKEDQKSLKLDRALLTVDYNQQLFQRLRAGDLDDYHLSRYFVDEEDLEGMEVTADYFDLDWTFLTAGFGETAGDDLFVIKTAQKTDLAEIYGAIYQLRGSDRITNLELGVSDYRAAEDLNLGGEVVFNKSKIKDTDDFLFNLKGDYTYNEKLTLTAVYENTGEDFTSYKDDLEEKSDYQLFQLAGDYLINDNNQLEAAYSVVQIGDQIQADVADYNDQDKSIIELALNNKSGAFKNKLALEYTINDDYTDNYESRLIELGTEYQISSKTKAAAAFVNKDQDNDGTNVINYNYLKANLDLELTDSISWQNEAKYILGEIEAAEVEGESNTFTTSLKVNF